MLQKGEGSAKNLVISDSATSLRTL